MDENEDKKELGSQFDKLGMEATIDPQVLEQLGEKPELSYNVSEEVSEPTDYILTAT